MWGEADRCVKFYQKKLERKENEKKKKTPVRPVAKYRSLVTQNTNMIMAFVNSMRHPAEYGIPLNQMAIKYVHINMLLLKTAYYALGELSSDFILRRC